MDKNKVVDAKDLMSSAATTTTKEEKSKIPWVPQMLPDGTRRQFKALLQKVSKDSLSTEVLRYAHRVVEVASMSFEEYKLSREQATKDCIHNLELELDSNCCWLNPCRSFCQFDIKERYSMQMFRPEIELSLASLDRTKKQDQSFYLVHKSVIQHAETMPMFEDLENEILTFSFEKYPAYTFVSHKWYGDKPDDDKQTFLKYLKKLSDQLTDEFLWIDCCCFPQIKEVDKSGYLNMIPEILINARKVELFRLNNKYQTSVWCAAESILTADDGFIQSEKLTMQNSSDLETLLPLLAAKVVLFAEAIIASAKEMDRNIWRLQTYRREQIAGRDAPQNAPYVISWQGRIDKVDVEIQQAQEVRSLFNKFIGKTYISSRGVDFEVKYYYLWCFTPAIAYLAFHHLKSVVVKS